MAVFSSHEILKCSAFWLLALICSAWVREASPGVDQRKSEQCFLLNLPLLHFPLLYGARNHKMKRNKGIPLHRPNLLQSPVQNFMSSSDQPARVQGLHHGAATQQAAMSFRQWAQRHTHTPCTNSSVELGLLWLISGKQLSSEGLLVVHKISHTNCFCYQSERVLLLLFFLCANIQSIGAEGQKMEMKVAINKTIINK